jgi:hypothetical protein
MRTKMLAALRQYAEGQIALHKVNVEVYLKNPAGIGEHPDVMEAVQKELHSIAEWEDQLFVLEKHFE